MSHPLSTRLISSINVDLPRVAITGHQRISKLPAMVADLEESLMSQTHWKSRKRHVPACLMRAGTSKGLFLDRRHLPKSKEDWVPWILTAMGSKNNDPRQIDGLGGATSTTSKVAVIGQSKRPGVDIDFTFAQVAVGNNIVDFSGTCGNISSGVGPYAVEHGLVRTKPGQKEVQVRIFNTNTQKYLIETIPLDEEGYYKEEGDFEIAGVMGTGSEVKVAFMNPAGSMTGGLFPTGRRAQRLTVESPRNAISPFQVSVTLIDASNPFVLVDSATLPLAAKGLDRKGSRYIDLIEDIRREGAVLMGLAAGVEQAAAIRGTPKVAVLSRPSALLDSQSEDKIPDIHVESMSMGRPHPSLQLTGAVCLAAAVCVPGTVAHSLGGVISVIKSAMIASSPQSIPMLLDGAPSDEDDNPSTSLETQRSLCRSVVIAHSSGVIQVDARVQITGSLVNVESCSVSRTARTLFVGHVPISA